MKHLRFQVVITDLQDYIIEYKDFNWNQINEMHDFIEYHATHVDPRVIKITRWNKKGERA